MKTLNQLQDLKVNKEKISMFLTYIFCLQYRIDDIPVYRNLMAASYCIHRDVCLGERGRENK